MGIMQPFRNTKPTRTYEGFHNNYRKYKIPLSDDFNNKCGYCDIKDSWLGGRKVYHIDHFAPKEKFPDMSNKYNNLVYSCPYCNISKSDDWVTNNSSESVKGNKGYIDPCEDKYGDMFCRDELGNIVACDDVAQYIYTKLNLGSPRHSVVWNLEILKKQKNELKDAEPYFMANDELKNKYIKLTLLYDEYFEYLGDLLNE